MLTLYAHPLSSFCWKALIALYENDTAFELHLLDQNAWGEFAAKWPVARMPALEDSERKQFVPEATMVIEYLDLHYPGRTRFIPRDADAALQVRIWDRFFDNYLQVPMQKIVGDRIRPEGKKDPHGVEEARRLIATSYAVLEKQLGDRQFAVGDGFTMADCAAAPALFYAAKNVPIDGYRKGAAYLERLQQRPCFARALKESEPYFHLYPAA
ncbi:glutathione S-transferase family protein [Terricaulis sp.]|uniref:glutathione S-transferase family protein n=1 Tax=Terricaulis sp. TaxID=2768686 RepID=UPI003783F5AC